MINRFAPILLFLYDRPRHTAETLNALISCPEAKYSDLIIFHDGLKPSANTTGIQNHKLVADLITSYGGKFNTVKIISREKNYGLSKNIREGIKEILRDYDKVIVLEDDIIVSNHFLSFINKGLELYESCENVASVSGYMYEIKDLPKTFFMRGADCWGWGTWKRAWQLMEEDGAKLLKRIKDNNLQFAFDLDGAYPYVAMLEDQVAGKNDSWAILWYASTFLKGMVSLCPGKTLIRNIGLDGSGVHSFAVADKRIRFSPDPVDFAWMDPVEDKKAINAISSFLKTPDIPRFNFKRMIKNKLRAVKKIIWKQQIPTTLQYGWWGDYANWDQAESHSSGYDSNEILEKCKTALLQVKQGKAVYERDGVLFNEIEYSWPVLCSLLRSALENKNELHVVDFGGSLGSSYFQNRSMLSSLKNLTWTIVEQPHFVDCGRQFFQDETLRFCSSIQEAVSPRKPTVFLLSGVLQYLEDPFKIINDIKAQNAPYIVFDFVPFNIEDKSRITIQTVPPDIYVASYPCWFFSKTDLLNTLSDRYSLDMETGSHLSIELEGKPLNYKCLVFKLKNDEGVTG